MICLKSLKQRLTRILYLVLPTTINANYWAIIPRNVSYEIAMYVVVYDTKLIIDTDVDAKKLISLLHQFDLIQHVNVPTHTAGNTLDLVISKDDLLVRDISTDLSVKSDHFAVLFTLSFPSPGLPKQTVTYRSWKSVDHDQLRNDIGEAISDFTCSDVESAVHNYNEVL